MQTSNNRLFDMYIIYWKYYLNGSWNSGDFSCVHKQTLMPSMWICGIITTSYMMISSLIVAFFFLFVVLKKFFVCRLNVLYAVCWRRQFFSTWCLCEHVFLLLCCCSFVHLSWMRRVWRDCGWQSSKRLWLLKQQIKTVQTSKLCWRDECR